MRVNKTAIAIFGTFGFVCLALLVAILVQLLILNPKADTNQTEIKGVGKAVQLVICAQAQSSANSYRVRTTAPDGSLEPIPHFITRMLAQRQTLSLARGLGCANTPGFPPFEMQISRALNEIRGILNGFRPEQRKATADHNPLLEKGAIPSVLFPALSSPPLEATKPNGGGGSEGGTQHKPPKEPEPTKEPAPAPQETTPTAPVPTHPDPEAVPAGGESGGETTTPSAGPESKPKPESLPGIVKEVVPPAACSLVDRAAKLCH